MAALASARKELIAAQDKAVRVHEATLKLEEECDSLRQNNATKDLELIRCMETHSFIEFSWEHSDRYWHGSSQRLHRDLGCAGHCKVQGTIEDTKAI